MKRTVLKLLLTGAILLLMSIGITKIEAILLLMSIGITKIEAILLLFVISFLAFPGLKRFVPGILFDEIQENKFQNGDDDFSDKWSDTTHCPKRAHVVGPEFYSVPQHKYKYPIESVSPHSAPALPPAPKFKEPEKPESSEKAKYNKIITFDPADQTGDSD